MRKERHPRQPGRTIANGRPKRHDAAPPHDRNAERSVLGSMLRNNRVIPEFASRLRPDDFYVFAHQRIFEGLAWLIEHGTVADYVTLGDWLKERQYLEDAGGHAYLVDLWDAAPGSATNSAPHVQIVLRFSAARHLIHLHNESAQLAAQPGADLGELAGRARAHLDELLSRIATTTSAAVVKTMSSIAPTRVQWLWSGRIPLRAVTIIDGNPGLGKSTVTTDIAARVSRGWAMPPAGGPCDDAAPAGVLLLSAEDDPETTIRPRLDAAGADACRIHLLEAIRRGDAATPPVLPWDLDILEEQIRRLGVVLVVIDPFLAYLDGAIDSHRDQDVRRCLHRLKDLAERTGAGIVLIRHLNKLHGGSAMYRGGGSIGIIGAARSALCVGRDPDDPGTCVLAPVKCNLAAMPRALRYRLEPTADVARIGWMGECDLLADDILDQQASTKQTPAQRCAGALAVLLEHGAMPSALIERELDKQGYSDRSIKAARKQLEVHSFKPSYEGEWMTELPRKPPPALPE
jgi:hypothetical protein